jgi:hypothetical protein
MMAVSQELVALRTESYRVVSQQLTRGAALHSQASASLAQETRCQSVAAPIAPGTTCRLVDELDRATGRPAAVSASPLFANPGRVSTILLILAGSLVTSNDAGLSVPDWPTSYGWNMFTFPPSMWVANIVYEHGHRLVASGVGALTIVMVCWLWIARVPRWLRWFGIGALS